jgi:hypothetical protein
MEDTRPHPVTSTEWREIMSIPIIRESWGIEDTMSISDFSSQVYAARFEFISGSPGYVGDLFILQGDTLTRDAPFVLRRDETGKLIVL